MKKALFITTLFSFSSFLLANDFYYEFDKKIYIKDKIINKEFSSTKNDTSIQEYTTTDGKTIKFRNEIVAQCNNITCKKDIENLGVEKVIEISKGFYFIKLDKNKNIFEYSRLIQELDSVNIAHPNFIKERILR